MDDDKEDQKDPSDDDFNEEMIADQIRRREELAQVEKERDLIRRVEAVAELATKQECWCGVDVVNPHSDNCKNIKRAVEKYEEAKITFGRIDQVERAFEEAVLEQEDRDEKEAHLTPGAQMAQETSDWAELLNEARKKSWNMSDTAKDGTDAENDSEPSEDAVKKLNELLGTKPTGQ